MANDLSEPSAIDSSAIDPSAISHPEALTIDIELNEDDERRALIATLTRRPIGRAARALYFVIAILSLVALGALVFNRSRALMLTAAALVGVTLLIPYLLRRASRESWALRSRKKIRYSFVPTHFRVEKGERATSIPWRMIDDVADAKELVVVYAGKEVHPIPLRHLGDAAQQKIRAALFSSP